MTGLEVLLTAWLLRLMQDTADCSTEDGFT